MGLKAIGCSALSVGFTFTFTFTFSCSAATASADTPTAGASDDTSSLQEIVVTARKRSENAQDTPISLVVATGSDLVEHNIHQFDQLDEISPALRITTSYLSPNSVDLSMRGQVLVDTRLDLDPAIGIYIDGVYIPHDQGTEVADMFDMNRVEVLAGPQGTLFGKNTTGGAINIYTNSPVQSTEGEVQAHYGNYGERAVEAMYNTPINDQLATRIVVTASGLGGYGINYYNGDELGTSSSTTVRWSALWNPSDQFTLTFRSDFSESQTVSAAWKGPFDVSRSSAAVAEACLERGGSFTACFTPGSPQLNAAYAAFTSYNNTDWNNGDTNIQPDERFQVYGASVTAAWNVTSSISLKSITAERGFWRHTASDIDGTPYAILDYPYMRTRDKQFSEELQLSGDSFDKRLNWITGLYYSNELGSENVIQVALPILSGAAGPSYQNASDILARSIGGFAQGSYRITDALSATLGFRMTNDKRELTQANYNDLQCQSLGVPLSSLPDVSACSVPLSVSYTRPSYTASLEYHFTPDLMAYLKTSQSYRSGGLQQTAGGDTPESAKFLNSPFKPETVRDYEIGAKTEWFDHRILANIAIFHTLEFDAIRSVSLPIPGSTEVGTANQNAASARINGTEIELRTAKLEGFDFGVNVSYLQAYFVKYITPAGQDYTNIPLLFTPLWQYNALVAYTVGDNWRTQLDWQWRSQELTAEPGAYSPANGELNGRSTWHFPKQFDVSLYGRNLADKRYLAYPVDVSASLGFILGGPVNPPRTFGVEISKKF